MTLPRTGVPAMKSRVRVRMLMRTRVRTRNRKRRRRSGRERGRLLSKRPTQGNTLNNINNKNNNINSINNESNAHEVSQRHSILMLQHSRCAAECDRNPPRPRDLPAARCRHYSVMPFPYACPKCNRQTTVAEFRSPPRLMRPATIRRGLSYASLIEPHRVPTRRRGGAPLSATLLKTIEKLPLDQTGFDSDF